MCTACGAPVPTGRIRILARRDDVAFVEPACPGCGSDFNPWPPEARRRPGLAPILDVAGDGPGRPRGGRPRDARPDRRGGRRRHPSRPGRLARGHRRLARAAGAWRPARLGRRSMSVPFAHASEAEMSRILDFYAVRWEYEPHTFPILWNLDGAVVESFSPDFYLPDLELYLEMTTLRQKLVRKKNRKLRRLRELYPDSTSSCSTRATSARSCSSTASSRSTTDCPGARARWPRRIRPGVTSPDDRHADAPTADRRSDLPPRPARPSRRTGVAGLVPLSLAARKDPRSAHERPGEPPRRRRRDPADRGGDRGQGPRARARRSAPTTRGAR